MSIEKHTTQALIIKSYEQGESDLTFKVFTRDFGMIFVLAKSIRKVESKLRMKMQIGKYVSISIVKGKEVWRLTGAEEYANPPFTATRSFPQGSCHVVTEGLSKNLTLHSHIISECVSRFLPLEKSQATLFDKLYEFLFLKDIDSNKFRALVYYVVLVETGYADAKYIGAKSLQEYKSFSATDLYTHFILNQNSVKDHLRAALSESML